MKRTLSCAVLGASLCMGAMAAAHAEDDQMRVKLAGVNLATRSGAQDALDRIHHSAARFCEADGGRVTLERAAAVDHCLAEMTHRSVLQLHAPLVTALYEDETDLRPAWAYAAR